MKKCAIQNPICVQILHLPFTPYFHFSFDCYHLPLSRLFYHMLIIMSDWFSCDLHFPKSGFRLDKSWFVSTFIFQIIILYFVLYDFYLKKKTNNLLSIYDSNTKKNTIHFPKLHFACVNWNWTEQNLGIKKWRHPK